MNDEPTSNCEGDVTLWLRAIENGDDDAATQLWSYCYPRLRNYSRKKLPEHLRRVLDEEDVALSAFKSFCLGAGKGAFAKIDNRDDLWKLLLCIAGRKAQGYVRHQNREKRGGGQIRGESIFNNEANSSREYGGIGDFADSSPTPAMMAQFADDAQQLIDMIQDDTVKTVALLRVEGYSVDEIAERMKCGKRTVERRLHLIRRTWEEAFEKNESPKDET